MNKRSLPPQDTDFYKAVLALRNEEECRAFFEDICALVEMRTIIQRFEVAKMLRQDKVYTEIMQELNASSATISRVARMMNYGTGCLGEVIDRLGDGQSAVETGTEAEKTDT